LDATEDLVDAVDLGAVDDLDDICHVFGQHLARFLMPIGVLLHGCDAATGRAVPFVGFKRVGKDYRG